MASADKSPQNRGSERTGKGGMIPPIEHRFQKGNRANPGGRPKLTPFADAYRKFAKMSADRLEKMKDSDLTGAEAVARGIILAAKRGRTLAAVEAADRTEGKVPQAVKVEGGDIPITLNISMDDADF